MTTKSVRKLRMMANDTYSTFPDCTFRAVVTVAKKYNDSLSQKNLSLRLRCAAKLSELCKLYALQVRLLLKRHSQIQKLVKAEELKELQSAVEGKEYNTSVLSNIFDVSVEEVPATLSQYLRRADQTRTVSGHHGECSVD